MLGVKFEHFRFQPSFPMTTLLDEPSRRRTFAIISEPDAGKTTRIEKLLFGGAIQIAGTVEDCRNA